MNDNILDSLAHVEVGTRTPDLATIERRSRAIVRGRRSARFGAIGLAVAATVTLGSVLPHSSGNDEPLAALRSPLAFGALPASADADPAACAISFSSVVAPEDWATAPGMIESASLLTDPPFELTTVRVMQSDTNCPAAVPAAVLYDPDPVRGISVWPDVQDPFVGLDNGLEEEPLGHVTVRGQAALLREHLSSLQITWLAEDGTRWMAMSSGFALDETVDVLDDLAFDGSTLNPASVPDDLSVAPVSTVPATTTSTTWEAWYNEKEDQPASDPPLTYLSATTAFKPPIEVSASMSAPATLLTDVQGHPAAFSSFGADVLTATTGIVTWKRDGVSYYLHGQGTIDEILALAETLEPVALDDPRVAAVTAP
ncbi:hypothetical protein [Sanguibacter antarcticus]|uniref:Uncharacterized protein n=1 Tax=Sanguibacter antarcticus TaxID=372484 RepID=A0A2A9E631_9MICO|nr:hypothetical protein [Sanguibacter antarcticus]PFG34304.1 hypothetical protein ATL42_2210 [Sanguibacter antarcticus]